jgi:hypothetical protein
MNITALKLEALDQRRSLERLIALYEGFQNYIENLERYLKREISDDVFLRVQSAYELRLDADSYRFREWSDGEEVFNRAIFTLVRRPEYYSRELLILATVKFEHLLEEARSQLEEIHSADSSSPVSASRARMVHGREFQARAVYRRL